MRWRRPSRCGLARRRPGLRRTACRTWRGLQRAADRDRSLGYCGPMSTGTHAGVTAGFPADFVARCLDDALASGARVYGITGLQGTGKSTLAAQMAALAAGRGRAVAVLSVDDRSEEHTSELQSLMRTPYAAFCLKIKKNTR